ncbi:killer cell lectin-like receptor subfamily G member 1 [Ascaphus truei]|uniref:killer cell lectin-like receptor subfamily G member 1 n=1 Tax=Ascaphus truei TaxID=8439 RepID=UPI003F597F19
MGSSSPSMLRVAVAAGLIRSGRIRAGDRGTSGLGSTTSQGSLKHDFLEPIHTKRLGWCEILVKCPNLDNKEFLITSNQTREEGAPVTWNPATQTREERDSVSWNPDTQTIENIAPCQGSEELTVSVKQNGWCQQVISWCRRNVIILLGFIGALILIVFVLSVCLTTRHPVLPLGPPCHIDWIWAKGKCYYFSDTRGDWESSRKFCISQNATLVMLKDKNVKACVQRYKENYYYWIGLMKDGKGNWLWLDGSPMTDDYIEYDGPQLNCAYLNSRLGALDCTTHRHWICVKDPD